MARGAIIRCDLKGCTNTQEDYDPKRYSDEGKWGQILLRETEFKQDDEETTYARMKDLCPYHYKSAKMLMSGELVSQVKPK